MDMDGHHWPPQCLKNQDQEPRGVPQEPSPTCLSLEMASYFTAVHQDAIVAFVAETDPSERERLWAVIHPAFDKLAEYWCNVLDRRKRFNHLELKADVLSMMFEKLSKFDPSKGSKAFSYFSIIARNEVMLRNNYANRKDTRFFHLDSLGPIVTQEAFLLQHSDDLQVHSLDDDDEVPQVRELLLHCIAQLEKKPPNVKRSDALVLMKAMYNAVVTDAVDYQGRGSFMGPFQGQLLEHLVSVTGFTKRRHAVTIVLVKKLMMEFAADFQVVIKNRRSKVQVEAA